MKIQYWAAKCLNDARVYNLRARTKKQLQELVQKEPPRSYGPPSKVLIEVKDSFELVCLLLDKGGGFVEDLPDPVESDNSVGAEL